ncbi:outer membrane beta-barrel family protein [Pedobacter africanus]|uniref:Outer membrane receptor proteins, mostly Fe transport n=1 Tax=Pedobacter africanus TaxID=151894 RepID=A0A1W2AEJ0_9SPHI|nr:outer membrane beta-barrel family protein [Pedobacter africanus]SMC59086.1 Outer membrane receptor proteins, mostly Fe transport [Pedobacter africanus]
MHRFFFLLILTIPIFVKAQTSLSVTVSGLIKDTKKMPLPYANVLLKQAKDSAFVTGTVSGSDGRFTLANVKSGNYRLEISMLGFVTKKQAVTVGTLSAFLDLGNYELDEDARMLNEIKITGGPVEGISSKMDKKTYNLAGNLSQAGGSVLQAVQNLPGVTVQDGKVQLRGNDKVAVLIDGKQNAITGFGSQTGLDNIPASAIESIEIINNPSARYDANGNAGIINIIYKKNKQQGFNGKIGLTTGLGALWIRKENLPTIRPQYQATPKLNPSLSLNYRKDKLNTFMQADWLYTQTLNRNDFAQRIYDDGTVINQQVKRNRTTTFSTLKTGVDWNPNNQNTFTAAVYLNREKILDKGDIPYFNKDFSVRSRLWQFLEDEVKYTATGSLLYQHKFKQPGHLLNAGFNYTFHREDEKYFFTNIMPDFTGEDAFKLLSDEHVADLNLDYTKPLKHGRLDGGLKFRRRTIPTNMQFFPGLNSPIDVNAGGWADYKETIPAVYGNYVFESRHFEVEAGLRFEYVKVNYDVNPNHNTYTSDGYDYNRFFPSLRLAYKVNDKNKISLFYNERVDRPNEVDIRIFPKYDEPEVIKVGNPTLRPQFTKNIELGHKLTWGKGSIYSAIYHKMVDATITRIATVVPGNTLIYNIFQNAGKSRNTGGELSLQQEMAAWFSFNASAALYRNTINAFTITNKYPVPTQYTMGKESVTSWNTKFNGMFKLPGKTELQLSAVYLAPDIIPQGRIGSRFSADMGLKKQIQKGKAELFLNGTDLFNTLRPRKEINGNGFKLVSTDYFETQVFRLGYNYKF